MSRQRPDVEVALAAAQAGVEVVRAPYGHDTEGCAYYRRKLAAGKSPMEALRCLKRRLSDVVYRQLVADANTHHVNEEPTEDETGPGGHCGASLQSSAVDLPAHIDTSDQPLPGPAAPTLPPAPPGAHPSTASTASPPRQRAGDLR